MPDDDPAPDSASTPAPDSASPPTPEPTTPTPGGSGLLGKAADLAKKGASKVAENVGDQFADNKKKKQKEEENQKADNSKMDPMMALYMQLGESVGKLNSALYDPIKDRASDLIQKGVDALADKFGNDKEAPKADADNPAPQADAANPAPQANAANPAPQADAANPAPQADAANPAPQAAAMTPFPNTPDPDPTAPLQAADTSDYDQKAAPTPSVSDTQSPDLEIGSQVSNAM